MNTKYTSFLMAVVVGIAGLVSAQIYLPTHLKPLTSHTLDYPGTIPTITTPSNIIQVRFASMPRNLVLGPQIARLINKFLPQAATIALIGGDKQGGVYTAPAKPAPAPVAAPTPAKAPKPSDGEENIDSYVPPAAPAPAPVPAPPPPQQNNEPKPSDGEVGISTYVPPVTPPVTPTPVTTVDDLLTTTYQQINGTEEFRYGYQVQANQTYVDHSNGETCKDGQGTVSGTYCAPNGERYNVNLAATTQAASEWNQTIAHTIADLTPEQVISIAESQTLSPSTGCTSSDLACQQRLLAQSIATIASAATVVKNDQIASSIADVYLLNQKANDYVALTEDQIKAKYGVTNIHEILSGLKADEMVKVEAQRAKQLAILESAKTTTSEKVVNGKTIYTLTTTYTDPETGKVVDTQSTSYYVEQVTQKEKVDAGFIDHNTTIFRDAATGNILDATTESLIKKTTTQTYKTAGRGSGGTVENVQIEKSTFTDANTGTLVATQNTYSELSAKDLSKITVITQTTTNPLSPNKSTTTTRDSIANPNYIAPVVTPKTPTGTPFTKHLGETCDYGTDCTTGVCGKAAIMATSATCQAGNSTPQPITDPNACEAGTTLVCRGSSCTCLTSEQGTSLAALEKQTSPNSSSFVAAPPTPELLATISLNRELVPTNIKNYATCNGDVGCNTRLTYADSGLGHVPGWDRYVDSFSPENTTYYWEKNGYSSIDQCRSNGTFVESHLCGELITNKEQYIATTQFGTNLTSIGAAIGSLPLIGATSAANGALNAFTTTIARVGGITTMNQTGNTVSTCLDGSTTCGRDIAYTALSWANLGTMEYVSNAFASGVVSNINNARIANSTVTVLNAISDGATTIESCFGENASGLGCTMSAGALIFDGVGGFFDYRTGQLIYSKLPETPINPASLIALADAPTGSAAKIILADVGDAVPSGQTTISISNLKDANLPLVTTTLPDNSTITRIDLVAITDPNLRLKAETINNALADFKKEIGYEPYPEQVRDWLGPQPIIQLKNPDGSSFAGKTDVLSRLFAISEPRTIILTKGTTEATEFINTQYLSDGGKKFFSSQNSHAIYIDSQRGFLEINLNTNLFEPSTARQMAASEVESLLATSLADPNSMHLTFIGDRANTVWTRLGGNESTDLTLVDKFLGRNGTTPSGVIMKDIASGEHGKFLVVADEISEDIKNNLAISGKAQDLSKVDNPELLGGLNSGSEAIKIYQDTTSTPTHLELVKERSLELAGGQSQSSQFKGVGDNQSIPVDVRIHSNTMADIIDQSLSATKSRNTSLGTTLESLVPRLRDQATAEGALKELDVILGNAPKTDLSLDLNFRKSAIQEDWNQLARVPGADFAQEGADLVLRKSGATTGERLSTSTQLLAFYDKGKLMLKEYAPNMLGGETINLSALPQSLGDIKISPPGTQMNVTEFYRELQANGHNIRGLDATPREALDALYMNGSPIETPLRPTNLGLGTERVQVIDQLLDNRKNLYNKKATGLTLAGTNVDMDADLQTLVRRAHEQGVGYDRVIVTQYRQSPDGKTIEEYIEYAVKDGAIVYEPHTVFKKASEWNDRIQNLIAGDAQSNLIVYKGRERGADLKVGANHDNIRWSQYYDATGNNLPTSVNAEQMWRRDRKFGTDFDMYVVASQTTIDKGLTKDNVWEDFFLENLYTKMADSRLNEAISTLGSAPKKAIAQLDDLPDTLKLSFWEKLQFNNLKKELAKEASSFEGMLRSATSQDKLSGEALLREFYRRSEATNARLLSMAETIGKELGLNADELKAVKAQLKAEDNFPKWETFLAELSSPTTKLAAPESFGPADTLMAFARNNTTDPSAPGEYRVANERYLASTAPLPLTRPSPATVASTPSTGIFNQLSSTLQSLTIGMRNLSLGSFIPNISPTPTLGGQTLADALRDKDLQTLTFTIGDQQALVMQNAGQLYYQPTANAEAVQVELGELLALLPSPANTDSISRNGELLPPNSYTTPARPADASSSLIASSANIVSNILQFLTETANPNASYVAILENAFQQFEKEFPEEAHLIQSSNIRFHVVGGIADTTKNATLRKDFDLLISNIDPDNIEDPIVKAVTELNDYLNTYSKSDSDLIIHSMFVKDVDPNLPNREVTNSLKEFLTDNVQSDGDYMAPTNPITTLNITANNLGATAAEMIFAPESTPSLTQPGMTLKQVRVNGQTLSIPQDETIANGEKVAINTTIDYTTNKTAKDLFENGYLPFSEFTNYLNLTVEQDSVATADDTGDQSFWDHALDNIDQETLFTQDEQNEIISSINSYTDQSPGEINNKENSTEDTAVNYPGENVTRRVIIGNTLPEKAVGLKKFVDRVNQLNMQVAAYTFHLGGVDKEILVIEEPGTTSLPINEYETILKAEPGIRSLLDGTYFENCDNAAACAIAQDLAQSSLISKKSGDIIGRPHYIAQQEMADSSVYSLDYSFGLYANYKDDVPLVIHSSSSSDLIKLLNQTYAGEWTDYNDVTVQEALDLGIDIQKSPVPEFKSFREFNQWVRTVAIRTVGDYDLFGSKLYPSNDHSKPVTVDGKLTPISYAKKYNNNIYFMRFKSGIEGLYRVENGKAIQVIRTEWFDSQGITRQTRWIATNKNWDTSNNDVDPSWQLSVIVDTKTDQVLPLNEIRGFDSSSIEGINTYRMSPDNDYFVFVQRDNKGSRLGVVDLNNLEAGVRYTKRISGPVTEGSFQNGSFTAKFDGKSRSFNLHDLFNPKPSTISSVVTFFADLFKRRPESTPSQTISLQTQEAPLTMHTLNLTTLWDDTSLTNNAERMMTKLRNAAHLQGMSDQEIDRQIAIYYEYFKDVPMVTLKDERALKSVLDGNDLISARQLGYDNNESTHTGASDIELGLDRYVFGSWGYPEGGGFASKYGDYLLVTKPTIMHNPNTVVTMRDITKTKGGVEEYKKSAMRGEDFIKMMTLAAILTHTNPLDALTTNIAGDKTNFPEELQAEIRAWRLDAEVKILDQIDNQNIAALIYKEDNEDVVDDLVSQAVVDLPTYPLEALSNSRSWNILNELTRLAWNIRRIAINPGSRVLLREDQVESLIYSYQHPQPTNVDFPSTVLLVYNNQTIEYVVDNTDDINRVVNEVLVENPTVMTIDAHVKVQGDSQSFQFKRPTLDQIYPTISLTRSDNTGCSDCSVVLTQTLKAATQAWKNKDAVAMEQVRNNHRYNHKFDDPHIQKAVESVLDTMFASLTDESVDYEHALSAITATKKLLDKFSYTTDASQSLTIPSWLSELSDALQQISVSASDVIKTLPLRGTAGSQNVQTHLDALTKLENDIKDTLLPNAHQSTVGTRITRKAGLAMPQTIRQIYLKLRVTQNMLLFQVQLRLIREDKIYSLSSQDKIMLRRAIANGNTNPSSLYYILSTLRYPALAPLREELVNKYIPQWLDAGVSNIDGLLETVYVINESHPTGTKALLDQYLPEWIRTGFSPSEIKEITAELSRLSTESLSYVAKEIPAWKQLPGPYGGKQISIYEIRQIIQQLNTHPETIPYIAPYLKHFRPQASGEYYTNLVQLLQKYPEILAQVHTHLPNWLSDNNYLNSINAYFAYIKNNPALLALAPYFNNTSVYVQNQVTNQALLNKPELIPEIVPHLDEWSVIREKYKSDETIASIIQAVQSTTPDRRSLYYQDLPSLLAAFTIESNNQYSNEYENVGQLIDNLNALTDAEYEAIRPYLASWINHGFISYSYGRFNRFAETFFSIPPIDRDHASEIIITFLGNSKISDTNTISLLLRELYQSPTTITELLAILQEMSTFPHYSMDYTRLVATLNTYPSLISKLAPYIISWYGQGIYDSSIISFIELIQKFPELPIEEAANLAVEQAKHGNIDLISIISNPELQTKLSPEFVKYIKLYIGNYPLRFRFEMPDGYQYYQKNLSLFSDVNQIYNQILSDAFLTNSNIKKTYESILAYTDSDQKKKIMENLPENISNFWNTYQNSAYLRALPDPVQFFESKLKNIAINYNQVVATFLLDGTQDGKINDTWTLLRESITDDVLALLPEKEAVFWRNYQDSPLLQPEWNRVGGLTLYYTIPQDRIKIYVELSQQIDDSPIALIQKIKSQLISQLLVQDNPLETYRSIENVLIKNNLPTFIKLRRIFDYLYPKSELDKIVADGPTLSPTIKATQSDGMRRFIFQRDLFRSHIESGNQELLNYLTTFNQYGKLIDQFMSGKDLDQAEIKQVNQFLVRMDALYRATNLTRIRPGLSLDPQQTQDSEYLRSFIKATLYTDLDIAPDTSLLTRIEELFLHNSGYSDIQSIINQMYEVKTETNNRNLAYAQAHPKLQLEIGDLVKSAIDSVTPNNVSQILSSGGRAREFMGENAASDGTPLDTDLIMIDDVAAKQNLEFPFIKSESTSYGKLIFVTKNLPGRFYRSDLGEKENVGTFELFVTGVIDPTRHVGIRSGYPSTFFDAIIDNGADGEELQILYQSIVSNGFYIPVYSKEGSLIFTPEMYQERLKSFAGLGNQPLIVNRLDSHDPFMQSIQQNNLKADLRSNVQDTAQVEQPIREKIAQILETLNIHLAEDPQEASLTDAVLLNIGSSGRGTNLPKDYDFDYTLILNQKDYHKSGEIGNAILELFPHQSADRSSVGQNFNQVRLSEVNLSENVNQFDLDVGIITREDSISYSPAQAVADRLNSLSDENRIQVISNILLTKKLLKEGHAYKAVEDGGFGGIGVENWILSNNGNIRQAFETFWDASHDANGNTLPLSEFQKNYPIYDPGINLRKNKYNNYAEELTDTGYLNMLKVIDRYLHKTASSPFLLPIQAATTLGTSLAQSLVSMISSSFLPAILPNLADYHLIYNIKTWVENFSLFNRFLLPPHSDRPSPTFVSNRVLNQNNLTLTRNDIHLPTDSSNPYWSQYKDFGYASYGKDGKALTHEQIKAKIAAGAKVVLLATGLDSNADEFETQGSSLVHNLFASSADPDNLVVLAVNAPGLALSELTADATNSTNTTNDSYRTLVTNFAKAMGLDKENTVLIGHSKGGEMAVGMGDVFDHVIALTPSLHLKSDPIFNFISAANNLGTLASQVGLHPVVTWFRNFITAQFLRTTPTQLAIHERVQGENLRASILSGRELALPDQIPTSVPKNLKVLLAEHDILTPPSASRPFLQKMAQQLEYAPTSYLNNLTSWYDPALVKNAGHVTMFTDYQLVEAVARQATATEFNLTKSKEQLYNPEKTSIIIQAREWLQKFISVVENFKNSKFIISINSERIFLNSNRIVKIINKPSVTNIGDVLGTDYVIRDQNGNIFKTGYITRDTEVLLPATDSNSIAIAGQTVSGREIAITNPDFKTYSWLESAAINGVLIISTLGFGLGMITMLWTITDTMLKTQAGIYYYIANTFGTNFANVVLGQFRDIFTLTGIFGLFFSMNQDLVKKLGNWFSLLLINTFAFGWMGLEFWQANLRGNMVDIADLIAFSVVPISTMIYGIHAYIRHAILLNPNSQNLSLEKTSNAKVLSQPPTSSPKPISPNSSNLLNNLLLKYPKISEWIDKNLMPTILIPSLIFAFISIIKFMIIFITNIRTP